MRTADRDAEFLVPGRGASVRTYERERDRERRWTLWEWWCDMWAESESSAAAATGV